MHALLNFQSVLILFGHPVRVTGSPPLTRFFGPEKNCVKGKPRVKGGVF